MTLQQVEFLQGSSGGVQSASSASSLGLLLPLCLRHGTGLRESI
jgi:hypothetical protein